ncbi:hypothetical protein SAY86_007256 [Trapa natans]|uniref:Uncharacterized protein n=1 Tax=Trapa natans TaxID=22666 RepID=A0AAN7QXP1_TRANT|nr:hypothetical protein SAY86_007256 [Trapa natans]
MAAVAPLVGPGAGEAEGISATTALTEATAKMAAQAIFFISIAAAEEKRAVFQRINVQFGMKDRIHTMHRSRGADADPAHSTPIKVGPN